MIITSKFNIGQLIKHQLLEFLGVIIDIDAKFSLKNYNNINKNKKLYNKNLYKNFPWYHVIIEDNKGLHSHTYLSENQISIVYNIFDYKKTSLYKLSILIKKQFKINILKN